MQPPRPSCKGSMKLHSSIFKTDLAVPNPKKWYFSRQASLNMGRHGLTRGTCVDAHTEKVSGSSKENASLMPQMCPADEGSCTGLKGSNVVSLLNSGSADPSATGMVNSGPTLERPNLCSHNDGISHQVIAMASRQLTIFYGRQAHVFDDVPPEKADAIMSLAGSNGRSWSTTYSPRPRVNVMSSASEGSLGALGRESDMTSKGASINSLSRLALSSELHTALANPTQSGSRCNHAQHGSLLGYSFLFSQLSTDSLAAAGQIDFCPNRQENRNLALVHTLASMNGVGKEG